MKFEKVIKPLLSILCFLVIILTLLYVLVSYSDFLLLAKQFSLSFPVEFGHLICKKMDT